MNGGSLFHPRNSLYRFQTLKQTFMKYYVENNGILVEFTNDKIEA